ncbi:MAG: hypothetical protein M1829_004353 [Trizodia sp. TS-e1964]|nr:MAG: hypothetical protein M1829_004353 [Trizodia sp. TS-e1964]
MLGRQFDRLGIMYLGDVEVFRTSTAEPTVNGIEWTYIKDMSHCHALFQIPQKIIFDLGNLIDETYTAPFNATLSASFFTVPDATLPAETIIPISARKSSSNLGSAFSLPHEPASSFIEFPRNAKRAIVTIAACGQADEEFWFANVLSSDSYAFPEIDHLLGFSPFREVQLFIDGTLAGVVWPFPIIFSGGVNPGLWRPVVGLDAFDLRERAIDITPWLAQLCDGSTEGHLFEIRVAGISDDGNKNGWLSATVGNNWVVTGKVFIWLDEPNSITTGNLPFSDAPQPSISVESSLRHNDSLTTHVQVSRSLSVSSVIVTSKGPQAASWNQKLTYTHSGELLQGGFIQRVRQLTQGNDNTASGYSSSYTYPVAVNTSFTVDNISGNFSILASVDRSLHLVAINDDILAAPLIPELSPKLNLPTVNGYNLLTRQNGSAYFLSVPKIRKSFATGTTEQHFSFDGLRTQKPNLEIYRRHVLAKDGGLLIDEKTILGESSRNILPPMIGIEKWPSQSFCGYSIRAILGRGPSGKSPAQQASGGE